MIFETLPPQQIIAWSLTILELILASYVLVLNVRFRSNRAVAALLFVFAMNNLGLGMLFGAQTVAEAQLATILVAMTSPAIPPLLLIVTVVLFKPEWFETWLRYFLWLVIAAVVAPAVLTVLDVLTGTSYYFTGLDPLRYAGGFAELPEFANGTLSYIIRMLGTRVLPVLAMAPLVYIAIFDKQISRLRRRLAWLLLAAQLVALVVQAGVRTLLPVGIPALFTIGQYVLVYAYAAFQQLVFEGRLQGGRLRSRLTAMVLVISVPLLVGSIALISVLVTDLFQRATLERLESNSNLLAYNVTSWLDFNRKALMQLAERPEIVSMNPRRQKPVLEEFVTLYPYMYLASTTDLEGMNVARSDASGLLLYSDRDWYQQAALGRSGIQTLIGRTSGVPALILSEPVRGETGEVIGVVMFASTLEDIIDLLARFPVGDTAVAYIIGPDGLVLASDLSFFTAQQATIDAYPPARAFSAGQRGDYRFDDAAGGHWQAHLTQLENDWGLVVQIQQEALLAQVRALQVLSVAGVVASAIILVSLSWLAFRQAFAPVETLTAAVLDITAGQIDREVPVVSEDELGFLADAFNQMTTRLRNLIGGLETEVAERTRDLQQRAAYLEAAGEVSRAATSILETERLIWQAVNLIRERFGLYYVGLFMLDPSGEWAVLRAGTGEAGRAMLARGHRHRIGSRSMISWCIENAEARIALQAEADAVRKATVELPDTRSEAALPLRSRGHVLGALTVQHTLPDAFDASAIAVLQTMADQLAVALDNAQLLATTQEALEATRRAYGETSQRGWQEYLSAVETSGYRYAYRTLSAVEGPWPPEMVEALRAGSSIVYQEAAGADGGRSTLAIPLRVREQIIGVLDFRKSGVTATWLEDERLLLEAVVAELGQALESARLYQETQRREARERLAGAVASRFRESLDLDTVLQTAVREIREALQLHDVALQLETASLLDAVDAPPAEGVG